MKKVLIVDDEEDIIRLIERRLKKENYHVIPALTGQEAIQKFKEEKPDIVLMDYVLPDMTGFEVCRRIKMEINFEAKIIVFTGKLEKVDADFARISGADELVVKSGDLKSVVNTIQDFLED